MISSRRQKKWNSGGPLFLLSLLILTPSAHAHSSIAGMGLFAGGLIHPLITPVHLLILLGLGLWLGQHPPLLLRTPMLLFAPFSALGLWLTTQMTVPPLWQPLLICLAFCIAFVVTLSARLAPWAFKLVPAFAALVIGLDSGLDSGASVTNTAITLIASWIALNLAVVNFAFYTSLCPPRQWIQIGIRVAGSWIAAICMLLLAFFLKGQLPG